MDPYVLSDALFFEAGSGLVELGWEGCSKPSSPSTAFSFALSSHGPSLSPHPVHSLAMWQHDWMAQRAKMKLLSV